MNRDTLSASEQAAKAALSRAKETADQAQRLLAAIKQRQALVDSGNFSRSPGVEQVKKIVQSMAKDDGEQNTSGNTQQIRKAA